MTGTFLIGLLAACGGSGDTTTAGETETSTGGTSTGTNPGTETGEPVTTTDPTTGGSQTGAGTTGTGPELTTTEDPTTGPAETSTGPVTTDTDTGPGETTDTTGEPETSGTSTTGEPNLCPPAPGDNECAMCSKEQCCDEAVTCFADEDCACFFGCLMMGDNPQQCGMQCMTGPMENEEIAALFGCSMENCGDVCGP